MGEMSWHLDPCNRLFPHHSPLAEQMRNKGGWHGNVQATGGSPLVEKRPHVAKSRRRKNIIEDGRQKLVYEHDKVAPAAHALALCRILITPASLHALRFRENLLCLLGMGVNAPKAQTSKEPRRALHNCGVHGPLSQIERRVFQERASITSQLVEIQSIIWI